MKRTVKSIILILVFATVLTLTACQKTTDLTPYLSQLRNKIFVGENDKFVASVFSEIRETPFIADGKRGELENVVIIKLKPKFSLSANATVSFSIDKEYSANLAFRPESDNFIATVLVNDLPQSNLTLTISHRDGVENVDVSQQIVSTKHTFEDALNLVSSNKKELIDNYLETLTSFEVQVRLIINEEKTFYFIGICDSEKTNCFLINAENLEIVAEKTIKNNSKNAN